jgi:hypothetical protein
VENDTAIFYRTFPVRENACSFSVHPRENKTVNTVSQQRHACVIWAYSRNVYQSTRGHIPKYSDTPLFADGSVHESSKQPMYDRSMYDFYTYRRIRVLVVQTLVTRCRACTGVHTPDRRHWASNDSLYLDTQVALAVWCVATGAGDSRKVMWDRNDKSYWTYGFCVHNLSTLTLNTNVSNCTYIYIYIHTRMYKLFSRFGCCTSGGFRCCVVAEIMCFTTQWECWSKSMWIKYVQNKQCIRWK